MQLNQGGGLRASNRIRENQRTCQSLSKTVELGGKYRLFFPMISNNGVADILTAVKPGRKLDREKLGKGFIAIENFEETASGRVIDKTGLDSYARMARVLHKAAEASEKEAAEREARAAADKLGTPVDQAALTEQLKKIETKYEGDNSDSKNPVYASVNPVVGPVVIEIATECLVVPLDATDKPKWSDAKIASVSLSSSKSDQLVQVLDDKNYARIGEEYLEVGYTYQGKDKATAGRNAKFQGISKDLTLEVLDAETFATEGIPALNRLATCPDDIAGRNFNMSSSVSPEEVISGFKAYCAKTPALFTSIDMESESTKYAAKDFVASGVVDKYAKVREALEALIDTDEDGVVDGDEIAKKAASSLPEGIDALRDVAANLGENMDAVAAGGDDNELVGIE